MAKKKAAKKPATHSAKQAMVVMVSGDRPIREVTKDLKAAGFEVGEVLHAIGQVTGKAQANLKKQLKSIRGVADVSNTHDDFDIGPPGAPIS